MQAAKETRAASRGLRSVWSIVAIGDKRRWQNGWSTPIQHPPRRAGGTRYVNLSTLNKILSAISCELVIVPLLQDLIEAIRAVSKQGEMAESATYREL